MRYTFLLPFVAALHAVSASGAAVCSVAKDAVFASRDDKYGRRLNLAIVDESGAIRVVAHVKTRNQTRALHNLISHGDYVVAQFWNEIEIYEVHRPRRLELKRVFTFKDTHQPWAGGGIVKEGATLVVLGTTFAAEIMAKGDPDTWKVHHLEPTSFLKLRMSNVSTHEARLNDPGDRYDIGAGDRKILLEGGAFDVRWKASRPMEGVVLYRQYLHAVKSGKRLLIDSEEEIIH